MFGATKKGEYYRTIELLDTIYQEQGLYFVLAFLWDSQYNREDIHEMMELIHPNKDFSGLKNEKYNNK